MTTETKISKLLTDLVEKSKSNRKLLVAIKNLAVRSQSYELAAELRELEIINFPDTEETKKLREKADLIKRVFQMADMNIEERTCAKIELVMNAVNEWKDEASIKDICRIEEILNAIYPETK